MITFTRTNGYTPEGAPIKVTDTVGVGTTLYTQENSERVTSDIWEWITSAYYWDAASGSIKYIWLDEETKHTIDCEFKTIANDVQSAFYTRNLKRELEQAQYEAKIPTKGRMVKVTRGKTAKGTEGKVVVAIERLYGMGWRSSLEMKLGIALDNEMTTYVAKNGKTYPTHKNMIWVWARNCEVVNPEVNIHEVEEHAMRITLNEIAELHRKTSEYRKAKHLSP
jgi:hypothetical protein